MPGTAFFLRAVNRYNADVSEPIITPLFAQHSRSWRRNCYVYPVVSRRSKGLSIGINLNPDTVCNFDCIYCCVDRTVPPAVRDVDLKLLRQELDHLLLLAVSEEIWKQPPFDQTPPPLRRLNDVAFSGDGEPTSFPDFGACCGLVVDEFDNVGIAPPPKIVVITNATLFHRPAVANALAFLDAHNGEIWAKLDAGTEEYYRLVERTSIPLQRVLDNILAAGRIRPIVIQSLFMRIRDEGPSDTEIQAYVDRLRELVNGGCQIKLVQVYTTARQTAESYVQPLPAESLDPIAARVALAGLKVETYYGPSL